MECRGLWQDSRCIASGCYCIDSSCNHCTSKWPTPHWSSLIHRPSPIAVFFSDAHSTWSLDGNASAHAPCHTPCVLGPLRRACWAKRLPGRLVVKRAIPQVILNNKELQTMTTMYFQWTVNKTGKYLPTVHCCLDRNNLRIVHHIVYFRQ